MAKSSTGEREMQRRCNWLPQDCLAKIIQNLEEARRSLQNHQQLFLNKTPDVTPFRQTQEAKTKHKTNIK